MQKNVKPLVLNNFCMRQFDKTSKSSNLIDFDPESFLQKVNSLYNPDDLREGYAPFCKHLFVENFTPATTYYQEITAENQHLLQSQYQKRRESELAVLVRYFPKEKIEAKECKYLDIILYSKEQIVKEEEAMGKVDEHLEVDYDWGIISVKCQDHSGEIPMEPITMLRNTLGKEYGGSGVPLDTHKYNQSVQFYQHHAVII